MKKLFENELHLLVSNLALKYWNYWITGKNLPYRTLNYSNFDVNTYQSTKKNMKSWSLQCLVGHTTKAPPILHALLSTEQCHKQLTARKLSLCSCCHGMMSQTQTTPIWLVHSLHETIVASAINGFFGIFCSEKCRHLQKKTSFGVIYFICNCFCVCLIIKVTSLLHVCYLLYHLGKNYML